MNRPTTLGDLLAAAAYNACVLLMIAVLWVLAREQGAWLALAVMVLAILLSPFFVVAHELGHALAGWAVGWLVLHVNFSILEFKREFGQWIARWCRPRSGLHGFVVAVPLGHRGLWWRDLLLVVGGPLANLLLAGLFLWGAWLNQGLRVRGWPESLTFLWPAGLASALCLMGMLTNLLIFFTSLAPTGGEDGHASDGLQMLSGFLAPKERDLALGLSSLWTLGRYGTRPRDWPADVVKRWLWDADPHQAHPYANLLGYWHAL
ncbi:MAG: hypothetical protein K2W96_26205, partial [Gemmataceae bacterium]|nr:hypothetical protein [Gemmataceae bacterium]